MDTKETLTEALRILRDRGRCQTWLVSPGTGQCCPLGAVGLAIGLPESLLLMHDDGDDPYEAIYASDAAKALAKALPDPSDDPARIWAYNDDFVSDSRPSDADIEALFERAIANA